MRTTAFLVAIFLIANSFLSLHAQNLDTVSAHLQLFESGGSKLYLLGTLHSAHARNQRFTWAHFDRIIAALSPDLLLIEIRPEHFRPEEFYSDGHPEMAYIAHLASAKGIQCQGIDWWLDSSLYNVSMLTMRDFFQREDSMVARILKAARTTRAKTILVTVGAGHVSGFTERFVSAGYKELPPPSIDLTVEHYPDLPKEVIQLWERGAAYLSTLPIDSLDRVRQKVNRMRELAKEGGYEFAREKK